MEEKPESSKAMTRRVSFSYQSAYERGELRHAGLVMRELSARHGFFIIMSEAFPIGDFFHFWLDGAEELEFPQYISEVTA